MVPVIGRAEKLRSLVVERDIPDGLLVSRKGLDEPSTIVDFPQFDFRVHGTGEQQMSRFGKPSNRRNTCADADGGREENTGWVRRYMRRAEE